MDKSCCKIVCVPSRKRKYFEEHYNAHLNGNIFPVAACVPEICSTSLEIAYRSGNSVKF